MTSRERFIKTMNFEEPDRPPFDLGATKATGISASLLYNLRKTYGRCEPVQVYDPFQLLGMIDERDIEQFNIDVVGLWSPVTAFGYRNEGWKPWRLPDGAPGLVGNSFNTTVDPKGNTYIYPQGDTYVPPSGKMPKGGHYFDYLTRQGGFDPETMHGNEDFAEQYHILPNDILRLYEKQADHFYKNTELGIVLNYECCSFGAPTQIQGPGCKHTPGMRDLTEWLMGYYTCPNYIKEVYELQTSVAIENLKLLKQAVGEKAQAIFVSSRDFGGQVREIISRDTFREFYFPYYKRVNGWIHENTDWKVLFHCCGSIRNIMDDMAECGVDCLNPIQCDAGGMDPLDIKEKYKNKLVLWGAGADSQGPIGNGSPEDVEAQIHERMSILKPGGGFVFAIVHNLQDNVPIANLRRVFDVLRSY